MSTADIRAFKKTNHLSAHADTVDAVCLPLILQHADTLLSMLSSRLAAKQTSSIQTIRFSLCKIHPNHSLSINLQIPDTRFSGPLSFHVLIPPNQITVKYFSESASKDMLLMGCVLTRQ